MCIRDRYHVDVVHLQADVAALDYLRPVVRSPFVGAGNVLPGAKSLIVKDVASETAYNCDRDLHQMLHSSLMIIAPVIDVGSISFQLVFACSNF